MKKGTFFSPEALGYSAVSPGANETLQADQSVDGMSDWEVAIRYQELKRRRTAAEIRTFRQLSASAILERAQKVLGSVVHPLDAYVSPWSELPPEAELLELELEETLENAPLLFANHSPNAIISESDLWMSYSLRRKQVLFLSVDTSLSMTGEKLALTAVALAVVLLQFPSDPIGIIAFENEAKIIKHPNEIVTVPQLVERFLDVPAQGYTHLEEGIHAALKLTRAYEGSTSSRRPPSVVLLTDGKYTAGRDPSYLASRFTHLNVLKMGKEKAGLELCCELAHNGNGVFQEVGELDSLPHVMYDLVKQLLRGGVGR